MDPRKKLCQALRIYLLPYKDGSYVSGNSNGFRHWTTAEPLRTPNDVRFALYLRFILRVGVHYIPKAMVEDWLLREPNAPVQLTALRTESHAVQVR
jgi:hypothetical protein